MVKTLLIKTQKKQQLNSFFIILFSSSLLWLSILTLNNSAYGTQIRDLASLNGIERIKLIGYGLVIDLPTAAEALDEPSFLNKALVNMIEQFEDSSDNPIVHSLKTGNATGVIVTAELSPFDRPGANIDVKVSSIADIKSISGGSLIRTNLKGLDGKIYAVAQGTVIINGEKSEGKTSMDSERSHADGRIIDGAIVEQALDYNISSEDNLHYQLYKADAVIISSITKAINDRFGENTAIPIDNTNITVTIPENFRKNTIQFVQDLETINIKIEEPVVIAINKQTGAIIKGREARIYDVEVSHGNLHLVISGSVETIQPIPLIAYNSTTSPISEITTEKNKEESAPKKTGVSVEDVTKALFAIGATPDDIITIMQTIKANGAIHGKLEILNDKDKNGL